MFRSVVFIASLLVGIVSGCSGSQAQWEITVENQADVPCSFFVTTSMPGGESGAKVENLAKGKSITLSVGGAKTVVQTVRVVRGKDEQTLSPKADLPVGKRYAISVSPNGKVEGTIVDR